MKDPLVGIEIGWAVFPEQGDNSLLFSAPKSKDEDLNRNHLVIQILVTDVNLTGDNDHVKIKNETNDETVYLDGVVGSVKEIEYYRGETLVLQFNEPQGGREFIQGKVLIKKPNTPSI